MFDTLIESRPSPLGLPRWGVLGAVGLHAACRGRPAASSRPAPVVPPIMVIDGFPTELTPPVRGPARSEGPVRLRIDVDLHLPPLPAPEPIPGVPDLPAPTPIGPDRNLWRDVGLPQDGWMGLRCRLAGPGAPGAAGGAPACVPATASRGGSGGARHGPSGRGHARAARSPGRCGWCAATTPVSTQPAAASIRGALFRPARVWGRGGARAGPGSGGVSVALSLAAGG